jgi:hypothetical protein
MDTYKMDTYKMDTYKMDANNMDTNNMDKYLKEYVAQLSEIEKTVLKIAQEHLETSFSLEKSIGFKTWYLANKLTIV